MKRFLLSLALVFCATSLFAQLDNSQVNGSFQVDGQYYQVDEAIGISEESIKGNKFGIAGFGKINYSLGNFSAGIRYEAYLPQLSGFDTRLQGVGLANYHASYDNGTIGITVGDGRHRYVALLRILYPRWPLLQPLRSQGSVG